ncbi:MAG: Fis family transcriptional regulator [Betaproteobacteria bacterium HGW-Betaproteobacteria-13]|jgi:Fis family transcriptional regulator|uniref:Putative Fis-like DNA-binding protein n=1 Tax=Parazoarcus communis TaxID=41977 RepID=A0A2U8GUB7_9RHOO|nr:MULTISPECIES: helix-turn-helix domain-containing protein [Zoogloeaceae]MCK9261318.1 Fis family transcriptional regulator [Azoarcus sp.]PKO57594.1 MAG: Fis family transcriptional regulator [Betaproteobacteria bacterium HGW-Betaproteobacteria-19]PKO80088.1 MAG: Fis family transcriptional regulator [Betaproteobacteria bacterium HGW-Betaproteobacteria-13]TVT58255.1 MAG: Fis family transcriptional regulator [Azoarcus sp. PHD]AWI77299.1 Fis family transcriptional regulator [Parazoarcus communis]|tara:strand:- start:14189 stop:14425 length:237 start_codon:yes stop_codon:yes gene_type:complete
MSRSNEIADSVFRTLDQYFRDLDGERPAAIYDMVIRNVERPMLEFVLQQAKGNQTVAADMLGINRNTLRRKLTDYDLL